jgi:hypothetical protein
MDIGELIRSAMPELEDGWQERADANLARILASRPKPQRWRAALRRWWKAIAASVVAGTLAVAMLLSPGAAYAATPPMLAITPISQSAAELLAAMSLLAGSQPARTGNEIVEHNWGFVTVVGEENRIEESYIDPEKDVMRVGPAGVDRIRRYTDTMYDKVGNPVQDPAAPAPGILQSDEIVAPEDQFRQFPDEPPTDPGKMFEYFSSALEPIEPSLSIDAIQWVRALLHERILTPAQESAVIAWLGTLPDLELLGEATDRLGRQVAVLEAPLGGERQERVMIDLSTGRIAGTEIIYRGHTRTDSPSPAVVGYDCWE